MPCQLPHTINDYFSLIETQRRYCGQFNTINEVLYSNLYNDIHIGDTYYIVEEQSFYVYDGNRFEVVRNSNNDFPVEIHLDTEEQNSSNETPVSRRLNQIIEESYQTSQQFIRFDENVHSFVYTPSDAQENFPYIPSQAELDDYEVYLRRRNPSCKNLYPIAIGKLAERFLVMINEGLVELSIE